MVCCRLYSLGHESDQRALSLALSCVPPSPTYTPSPLHTRCWDTFHGLLSDGLSLLHLEPGSPNQMLLQILLGFQS